MLQQIEQLAQNIVIARKRRGESQAQWAKKLGISQPTMARIERGDPSVAMASYVMCMWLINQAGGLADLIAPQNDHAALEKEVAKVRAKRKPAASPAPSMPSAAQTPVASKHALAASQKTPAVQIGATVRNMPTGRIEEAMSKLPGAQIGKALSPGLEAVMAFHNSPTGQMFKTANKNSDGLAALLAKTDPKKK
ncbi:helix-turn-helix domain-containing protein [Comamonas guangdongensis]|uniref:helix-turn-helix domain-containing protein n=1 Tax=Comamonas guangdongensis TaxID=510515 RepID=UPI0034E2DE15